jgi:hypothetical protein
MIGETISHDRVTARLVSAQLAVLELWIFSQKFCALQFVGIHFENSVRILSVVIHLGKLKNNLQREVAPYRAVCVPVLPVQHASF